MRVCRRLLSFWRKRRGVGSLKTAVLGLITTLLGHDGTDFHAVKVGTDARLEVKPGLQGADYVPLPIDDDGYLQVVNMATDWPSAIDSDFGAGSSANTNPVLLLTVTLTMPKAGVILAAAGVICNSSVADDRADLYIQIDGVSGPLSQPRLLTTRNVDAPVFARQAVAAGNRVVNLYGYRGTGTGTVQFGAKQMIAWGIGA